MAQATLELARKLAAEYKEADERWLGVDGLTAHKLEQRMRMIEDEAQAAGIPLRLLLGAA